MMEGLYPVLHAVQCVPTAAVLVHVNHVYHKFVNSDKISFGEFLAYLGKFPTGKEKNCFFYLQWEIVLAVIFAWRGCLTFTTERCDWVRLEFRFWNLIAVCKEMAMLPHTNLNSQSFFPVRCYW